MVALLLLPDQVIAVHECLLSAVDRLCCILHCCESVLSCISPAAACVLLQVAEQKTSCLLSSR
jgi:hypothetical protein